jgi:hypothetical protein
MKYSIALIFVLMMSFKTKAQHLIFGLGSDFIHQKGNLINVKNVTGSNTTQTLDSINNTHIAPALYANIVIPVIKFSEENSLGLMTGIEGFFSSSSKYKAIDQYAQVATYGNASSTIMGFHFPLYMCYTQGPNATIESDAKRGYMIAWGLVYTGFQIPTDKGSFLAPAAMAEYRFNHIGIRVEYLARRYGNEYATYSGFVPRLTTRFFQFSLNYNLPLGKKYQVTKADKRIVKQSKNGKK